MVLFFLLFDFFSIRSFVKERKERERKVKMKCELNEWVYEACNSVPIFIQNFLSSTFFLLPFMEYIVLYVFWVWIINELFDWKIKDGKEGFLSEIFEWGS